MVLDNLESSYSGQFLLEDSSDHVLSIHNSDDTLALSTRNNPRQRLDKGKQNAASNTFLGSYSYHRFPLESFSAGASASNTGAETGVLSTTSIPNRQRVNSGPSTTSILSKDKKRKYSTASTSMVMHMLQSQLINVGLAVTKNKTKWPSATIDPNLNRITPYLPKEAKMFTEAARLSEEEWSFLLSSSSNINWDYLEPLASAPDIGRSSSLSTENNLSGNASTSQAIPNEFQANFISAMATNSHFFDHDIFYLDQSLSCLERNLEAAEEQNLANYDISTFHMDHLNQAHHQLNHSRTSNLFPPFHFTGLYTPNGKAHSPHDNVPFDQQSLERLSLGYDNLDASQIVQQSEVATSQLLPQNTPSDTALLAYDDAQKTLGIWPSKSKNLAFQFSYEDPNQKVTQTEHVLSNLTQGCPHSGLPKQTTSMQINSHFNGNTLTPSLGSNESFSDETDPASEETYIPDDVMYDDANWRSDPTLERKALKFPSDLYTPHWIKIKDGVRWGLCRYCFKEDCNMWLKIKCSSYRYHMNTKHGICSNGKYFAEPLEKRIMPDGSVDFYCGECNRYKHIQRHAQDDIFKWWRHASECHVSSRRANKQYFLKRL